MQNFEALDYLIKNNKQNQGGLRKNYYKFLIENMSNLESGDIGMITTLLMFANECVITWLRNGQLSTSFSTSPVILGALLAEDTATLTIKAFVTYPDIPKYVNDSSTPIGDIFEYLKSSLESAPPEAIEEIKYMIGIFNQLCVPITKEEYDQIFKEAYDSVYK